MTPQARVRIVRTALAAALSAALAAGGPSWAQSLPGLDRGPAQVASATPGRPLAAIPGAPPEAVIAGYLRSRGRSEAVLASLRVAGARGGAHGVTHLRLEQWVDGLAVHGAYVKAALDARGALVHLIERLAPVTAPTPSRIDAAAALAAAMARVHPAESVVFRRAGTEGALTRFDGGDFFHEPPTVTAVAIPMSDGTLARGWLVETWTARSNALHHTLVGGDGRVLDLESRTATDSYNVFPIDPGKGPQTVVGGPGSGNAESPAGWLAGRSQNTVNIGGNNVRAYLDRDNNNSPDRGGSKVTSGDFLASANLAAAPTTGTNQAVAVQNLFHLNNVMHDLLYRHGFDEPAGNFQADNFGRGGKPRDPVLAEAQDGGGTDNANFSTPPDGRSPRMQMYLWSGAGPSHEVVVNSPVARAYGAMGASFGPALSTGGVTGDVVLANDGSGTTSDACEAIQNPVAGRVVLVDRGQCTFVTKVANAQAAGAAAVIVANNTGGTEILTMGGTDNTITIPSVMIGQNDGAELRTLAAPNATLRRKAAPPLQIDAALDSDIVYHEYCHGLTWRMIGGMSGPLAGAIGEGMSDGCAMLVNGDAAGGDVIGEYSASNPLGIRRNRYSGYPRTYGDVTGASVHDDGEIYAAIVWKLIGDFGSTRRAALFGHLVDGMNYTPSTPAYEQMRDGILGSIAQSGASGDACTVWRAFAQFGVGVGASGTVSAGTVQIVPSFATPAGCP